MQIFTYKQYIEMIPSDTAKFVRRLFSYLYNSDLIEIGYDTILHDEDKLLFKALRSYKQLGESYRNTATILGYDNETFIPEPSISDDTASRYFTTYYKVLTPFEYEEEYLNLTPEDIIRNIYKERIIRNRQYVTTSLMSKGIVEFMKGLKEAAEPKKKERLAQMSKDINGDITISVMNYYDMVGKLFYYLRKHKEDIENYDTDVDSLKNLAMFLAIFYYKHVTVYQENYNEQKIIVEFLESKGIALDLIKNTLGIEIDEKELNNIDSTLVLKKIFNGLPISKNSNTTYNVGYIYSEFLAKGLVSTMYLKKLLSQFDCTISTFENLKKVLESKFNSTKITPIEEIYKGMLPTTITYLKHIAQIYTYLLSKKDTFDPNIIPSDRALFVLAILMTSYENGDTLSTFLNDTGMTQEKVLEFLKLPSLEEFNKEVSATEADEKAIARFSKIILEGYSSGKSKDTINKNTIVTNICVQDYSGTSILPKIYISITKKKLENNCLDQVSKHIESKNEKRKRDLTEELLKDIPIETFEFLKILCSYYIILKSKKLDAKDLEQLSIICAATRANKELEKYMESFGITRTALSKAFEVDFSYSKKTFDIDIIKDHFTPYVFDRPNEEITVYSVFENAFKPELTNTLNLRRVLNTFKKEPEDFLDIEEKLEQDKKDKAAKEQENQIEGLIKKLDEPAKKVIYDTLLIHNYIDSNKDKLKLIKTENDIKAISLLISVLMNNESCLLFFNRNGITLDVVLNSIGLDKKQLDTILSSPIHRELVLKYRGYFGYSSIDSKYLTRTLFYPEITTSPIIREITESTGNNYEYLAEEVKQLKEREPSPEQGIRLLSKEEVHEIADTSFTSIVDFGISISKHSKYINNAINVLATAETIDHSLEGINGLLGEVTTEEVIEPEKKQTFLSKFFGSPKQAQVIKKYNPEKIDELQDQVEVQIQTLSKELKGYEQIKNYIELFLKKLHEHLEYLKKYSASYDTEEIEETLDEIEKFTKTLDRNSSREILQDKINTFETMILLMKQELVTVHRAIINHFIAINSLQTSRSAILPLLTTEIALSAGKESEKEAFELAGGLVRLFGSVVNGNAEETRTNLERLKLTAISDETYSSMSKEVNAYLESLGKSRNVLDATKPADNQPKQTLDNAPILSLGMDYDIDPPA